MSKPFYLFLDCFGAGAAGLTALAVGSIEGLQPLAVGVPALALTISYLAFVDWLDKPKM